MTGPAPIRREIVVPADPDQAFEVFTARIGRWWPVAEHSVHGAGSTVEFEGGRLIERSPSGPATVWGSVTRWEPGVAVAFTWHPGRDPGSPSRVLVTFTAVDEGTLVALTHGGWEVYTDPQAARDEYDHGWPAVLDRYVAEVREGGRSTWAVLTHRPGPSAPPAGAVVDDPRFAGHLDFLQRLRAAGQLVAAGPFEDAIGEGMTVVRVAGDGHMDDIRRWATEDDTSVVAGLLAVRVRPWRVVLTA